MRQRQTGIITKIDEPFWPTRTKNEVLSDLCDNSTDDGVLSVMDIFLLLALSSAEKRILLLITFHLLLFESVSRHSMPLSGDSDSIMHGTHCPVSL